MNMPLAEVLERLDLEPGRSYRAAVKGYEVEVRVLGKVTEKCSEGATTEFEDGRMLDPWFTIPNPPSAVTVIAGVGEAPPFDRPEIPSEDEVTR